MKNLLPFQLLIITFVSCKYDKIGPPDIKYSIEGTYKCAVYHDWWDWTIDSFKHDFEGYDTVYLTALEGDSMLSFQRDSVIYEIVVEEFNDGELRSELIPGHKYIYFYPPDSLHYIYCLGLGPDCEALYGNRIPE
ncbi:MAG: hypothetical protein ACHQFW_00725 [Chitinophagales bacterium]